MTVEPANRPFPPDLAVSGDTSPASIPAIVRAMAESGEDPWFPSEYAARQGISRDALDVPLIELRLAGLAEIVTWVRGKGQGYRLTPAGRALLGSSDSPATVLDRKQPVSPAAIRAERPNTAKEGSAEEAIPLSLRPPLVTWLLIAANVAVFLAGIGRAWSSGGDVRDYLRGEDRRTVHALGAVSGYDLLHGDWHRLISANFAHFGVVHLLLNMAALGLIGREVEVLFGRIRTVLIYLLSGWVGTCLAMIVQPDVLLAGASAAVWGLLAAAGVWYVFYRRRLPEDLFYPAMNRLVMIVMINVVISLLPGISWSGHLGGALLGAGTALLMLWLRSAAPRRWLPLVALVVGLATLCGGALWLSMHYAPTWSGLRQRYALEQRHATQRDLLRHLQQEVLPRLEALRPDQLEPLRRAVVWQALRPVARRNSLQVKQLQEQIAHARHTVAEIPTLWPDDPAQAPDWHRRRQTVLEYLNAVAALLETWQRLLDHSEVPDAAAWEECRLTREAVQRAWEELHSLQIQKWHMVKQNVQHQAGTSLAE